MTPSELKRAKSLSATIAALNAQPTKKKERIPLRSYPYASLKGQSAPWLQKPIVSPLSPKVVRQEVKVERIEVPMFYGKPGKDGKKGDSIKGDTGKTGRDGYTPKKGEDYLTQQEIDFLKEEITNSILSQIPQPQEVGPQELIIDEEMVKKIVQMMHKLPETDKLEVSQGIRNASSFIFNKTKYDTSELMHGGSSGTGGSTTPLTPTGIVNAVNNIFGVVSRPSSVIADGITYFEGFGYSYAANVITLDVPPSQYIRYYV